MKSVIVIGTVFVDVKGFPAAPLDFAGRNLGEVRFAHGGVGRNVAETMARLGAPVQFVSSVTAGGVGDEVLRHLQGLGVGTDAVAAMPEAGMGMWLALFHHNRDVAASISQMPDLTGLKQAWRACGPSLLQEAGLCVLEVDLDGELAQQVLADAAAAGVPVVGLPGNLSVIRSRPDLLPGLDALVLNQHEAEVVLGSPVAEGDALDAAIQLRGLGLRIAVVTLGAAGAAAAGPEGAVQMPAEPVRAVDTTGAGDAFVSGFGYALLAQAHLRTALGCGTRVAAWTVGSAESVCTDLAERISSDAWPGWRELR